MKEKVGRNDPCPCGSGKKHKACCWHKKVGSPLKRKFTAKVLSAGGAHKPQLQPEASPQALKPVDYNLLMERSFGEALHSHEEKPPLPKDLTVYLTQEKSDLPAV